MSSATHYILTWQCPDNTGVLAKVSQSLFSHGAFITETSQYSDPYSETFFSRIAFDDRNLTVSSSEFVKALNELAKPLAMQYQLRKRADVPNVLIAVSKDDHCLVSLLTKWRSGALPINIVGVISNHQYCQALSEWHNVPFYHLPVNAETKLEQEAQITDLMEELNIDLLVLARYMQILSDGLCQQLQGKAINIHHSFLPSFKGARPYHQAHARGVKVIGATAHYVTANLDEGPIIAQEVKPINHAFTIEQMVHMGHDLEATALSHAVRIHAEQRVCINGDKTVILA
ncbi:formyltetrahydrofolate deformylase [Colwellia psychrerythraea]|uniref:Formyltetrahydrofolate deformylase n=1 Tax=Colwellia psychrerythraea (strain 34H / ATCC BAA-681) TaxID=167879 RepID=Q47W16_COLP3|nr:formyltetrahydrofolate deformylase [Colwellia psychrerythraea]AAZ27696.1 formyltetrahydrofolate deformylase [Colwellia psychrerythraea 34H]